MDTYTVTQVETLTGIKAPTLRIWERRYDFPRPMRTPTNIRYYSDAQLRKLLNISILLKNGYRISGLSKMPDAEIHGLVYEILANPSARGKSYIYALTGAMLEMNEEAFNRVFQAYCQKKGLLTTMDRLIYPFLRHVGLLWVTNKAFPAQEHFISNLIRQKIVSAIENLPDVDVDAPTILLFLPEDEYHDIGLLLANYIAKNLGWKVYYLGQNVPSLNIKPAVEIIKPQLMMTIFITPKPVKADALAKAIVDDTGIPLLVSGNPDYLQNFEWIEKTIYISNPIALGAYLKDFKPRST